MRNTELAPQAREYRSQDERDAALDGKYDTKWRRNCPARVAANLAVSAERFRAWRSARSGPGRGENLHDAIALWVTETFGHAERVVVGMIAHEVLAFELDASGAPLRPGGSNAGPFISAAQQNVWIDAVRYVGPLPRGPKRETDILAYLKSICAAAGSPVGEMPTMPMVGVESEGEV